MNVFPEPFRFFFEKNGIKTTCMHAPEEWESNVIKWSRDNQTEGILTQYVDKFTFVLEDAKYLIACFEERGVFAKVKFIAEEYDYSTFEYKQYYAGDLDFYSFEEDKYRVTFSVSEIGFKVALSANLDTKYDIPIDTPVYVKYDGIRMVNTVQFQTFYFDTLKNKTVDGVLSATVDASEAFNIEDIAKNVEQGEFTDEKWIFEVKEDTELVINVLLDINKLKGPEAGLLDTKSDGYITIYLKSSGYYQDVFAKEDNTESRYNIFKGTFEGDRYDRTFYINATKGQKYYFGIKIKSHYFVAQSGGSKYYDLDVDVSATVKFKFEYKKEHNKKIPGIRPAELLTKLVEKATDSRYSDIDLSFFTNEKYIAKDLLITSGNLIRGIEDAKINTSVKDFFKAMQVLCGATYWFDTIEGKETLVIRHIYDAFANKRIAYTEDINEYKRKVYDSYVYNQLEVGYKDNTYDEVNGKFEFNTQLFFSIDTDAKTKKFNLISPYRADMYGIEFLILNYEKKDTTDSESDNDTFVMHTSVKAANEDNTYILNRNFTDPGGIAKDTAFNIQLSPKHCLLRQINYIASIFQYAGPVLKFSSSEKDYNMTAGDGIEEHADVDLSGYDKLFIPIKVEFLTRVEKGIAEVIKRDKNGYIRVVNEGKVTDGFIIAISENPGRNKSQSWEILVKK